VFDAQHEYARHLRRMSALICLLFSLTLVAVPDLAFAGPVRSVQEIRQSPIVPVVQYGQSAFYRGAWSQQRRSSEYRRSRFRNRTMSVAAFEAVWKVGIGFVVTR
jgi:hypothetical protein